MSKQAAELKQKTEAQLKETLIELRREQLNLRFLQANNQIQDTSQFRKVRRQIARVKTILREKA